MFEFIHRKPHLDVGRDGVGVGVGGMVRGGVVWVGLVGVGVGWGGVGGGGEWGAHSRTLLKANAKKCAYTKAVRI